MAPTCQLFNGSLGELEFAIQRYGHSWVARDARVETVLFDTEEIDGVELVGYRPPSGPCPSAERGKGGARQQET